MPSGMRRHAGGAAMGVLRQALRWQWPSTG
jgi:hypothetical protein